jgi:hypothetical protein
MSVDIELRKAAAFINAARFDAARDILSEYLKDTPDSDVAWLLMSYALDEARRQQAAATRALRLNPENEQARDRVDQLLKRQAPLSSDDDKAVSLKDLTLTSRHDLGSKDEEIDFSQSNIRESSLFTRRDKGMLPGRDPNNYPYKAFLNERISDKSGGNNSGASRSTKLKSVLMGIGLVFILIVVGVFAFRTFPQIFMSEAERFEAAVAGTGTALATENVGIQLPASWTPTLTPTVTKTRIPSPTPTITNTPTPFMTRTLGPTRTPITPDPTVVSEMEALQQQVNELRELSTDASVKTNMIHPLQARSVLERYFLQGGGSEEEILNSSKALVALGLIEPGYNLLTYQLNTLAEPIGGFYRFDTNQIYISGYQFTAIEKYAYVQEYNQALMNLNFNINNMDVYPRCGGNEDSCRAIRALIEGDAALLSSQWLEQEASSTDYDEIENYRPPTFLLLDRASPPFTEQSIEFPYVEGMAFVEALFSSGGWSSVNNAYDRLPLSTEQILHPEKYLSGEQPIPMPDVDLGPILGEGWSQSKNNTLGEWLTYLILRHGTAHEARVDEFTAVLASEGWGGDRYQVYTKDETSETVLVVNWKWDGIKDSNEFTRGMREYLKSRFSSGEMVEADRECWYSETQYACLYTGHQRNLWILAPSMDIIDNVQTLYPEF